MRQYVETNPAQYDARRPASNASYSTGGYRGRARAQPCNALGYFRPRRPDAGNN